MKDRGKIASGDKKDHDRNEGCGEIGNNRKMKNGGYRI